VDAVRLVQPFSAMIYDAEKGAMVRIHHNHEHLRGIFTDGDSSREAQLDRMIATSKN